MNDLSFERHRNDSTLRRELEAAARRERARQMKRFLEQAAQSLLGDRSAAARVPLDWVAPCEAC